MTMKTIFNPPKDNWKGLVSRPGIDSVSLREVVGEILSAVQSRGDEALNEFNQKFQNCTPTALKVTEEEFLTARQLISENLRKAIGTAASNIKKFHSLQKREDLMVETTTGVYCSRIARPIEKPGLYIPGGTAPLFSTVLMLGIPATLAGCSETFICTPPQSDGSIHPAILFAAYTAGIKNVFKCGGAQAIAAMAYGTQTIPRADKIFGPGNQFVTIAKMMVQMEGVAIDMPAGPSEVLVIADSTADPVFIAADLLSQAEHGNDSQVVLVTTDKELPEKVDAELTRQLEMLPRKKTAALALENSFSVVLNNINSCVEFSNAYAPEHLIIQTETPRELLPGIRHAGSIFLGHYSPEAAGDYASGTNHTLPTAGNARAYSGVSLDSFLRYITVQEITQVGIQNLGPVIQELAAAEALEAHRNAVTVRLQKLKS